MEIWKATIPILAWKSDYPPCHHCGKKKGNAPQRSCIRTDVKFNKYNHLGHISKICKFQLEK
jgi:hypothetical protein